MFHFTCEVIVNLYFWQSIISALGKKYKVIIETNQVVTEEVPPRIPETNTNKTSQTIPSVKPTQSDLNNAVESRVIQHFDKSENIYTGLLREKTFENFVSGPSNKMSYAAAVAVSNKPGELYPSLYIHGGSGLGNGPGFEVASLNRDLVSLIMMYTLYKVSGTFHQ